MGVLPRAEPMGDSAVIITFGVSRSAELLGKVHAAAAALSDSSVSGVYDIVPGYLSLAVFYDPFRLSYMEIAPVLTAICERASVSSKAAVTGRQHKIPVAYDGPDLVTVSSLTSLSTEDVIERHISRVYTVDIIGFVPGFAYLSELDPSLRLPRRTQPRPRVPAGSVAIAGAQTGVYPLDTPGGWHILGHTTTVMFDPAREPPAILRAGDTVQFVRVD